MIRVFQSVSKCQELEREVISRNSKTVTEYRATLAEVGNRRLQRLERKVARDVTKDPRATARTRVKDSAK